MQELISNEIKTFYQAKKPVLSFEVFPPKKDADAENICSAIGQLSALLPNFISVTYGAGGTGNGNKTAEIASFIQQENGVPALAHLTCVGATKEKIRTTLGDLQARGVKNIMALRGDLPEGEAAEGDFKYAEDLIKEARDYGDFCIGAACYPEGHIDCADLAQDTEYLRRKQEAGADFLITQLFFDNEYFFRFLERARKGGVTLPVSAGVMPILGRSQIERMIFLCGVSLPAEIIKILHKHENNTEDLKKAGIEYAAGQIEELVRQGAQGIHIYTMNKPEIATYCAKQIGRKP